MKSEYRPSKSHFERWWRKPDIKPMAAEVNLAKYHTCLESTCPIRATGRVTDVVGLVVEAHGPVSCLGTVCDILKTK